MKDAFPRRLTTTAFDEGELITLEKLRMLYKGGKGISMREMRKKIKNGEVKKDAVIEDESGHITLVHLPTLMGLRA